MSFYQFLDQTITLLLVVNDKKTEVKLTPDVLNFEGDYGDYRIGDFRQFIFQHWDELWHSKEQDEAMMKNKPEVADQIQMLYLGSRLNPNGYLKSLNLETSRIFHLIIRSMDLLTQNNLQNEKKKFDFLNVSRRKSSSTDSNIVIPGVNQMMNLSTVGNTRRGSSSNAPVPVFVSINGESGNSNTNNVSAIRKSSELVENRTLNLKDTEDEELLSILPKHMDENGNPAIVEDNEETEYLNSATPANHINNNKTISSNNSNTNGSSVNNNIDNRIAQPKGQTTTERVNHASPNVDKGGCCIIV